MGWRDVSMKELKLFFADWKTRKELTECYGLSNTSSYHCFKHLMKLKTDFEFEKVSGKTRKIFKIRTLKIKV